jgi:hypothetical protein
MADGVCGTVRAMGGKTTSLDVWGARPMWNDPKIGIRVHIHTGFSALAFKVPAALQGDTFWLR